MSDIPPSQKPLSEDEPLPLLEISPNPNVQVQEPSASNGESTAVTNQNSIQTPGNEEMIQKLGSQWLSLIQTATGIQWNEPSTQQAKTERQLAVGAQVYSLFQTSYDVLMNKPVAQQAEAPTKPTFSQRMDELEATILSLNSELHRINEMVVFKGKDVGTSTSEI
uniref:Mediator of RNA polymerase II transcription subunit 30 n=1 Tax=Caenorhabditis tropicalis TaxID=1561998 RepID=A0A1I7UGW5_9PELO